LQTPQIINPSKFISKNFHLCHHNPLWILLILLHHVPNALNRNCRRNQTMVVASNLGSLKLQRIPKLQFFSSRSIFFIWVINIYFFKNKIKKKKKEMFDLEPIKRPNVVCVSSTCCFHFQEISLVIEIYRSVRFWIIK
jgi:hypothetical protein